MENTLQNTAETANETSLRDRAAAAAARLMERDGCKIVERGWECTAGSIDLVAEDDGALVFAAVRVCELGDGGFPDEDRSAESRHRLELIAANFLAENARDDGPIRFDIIAIMALGNDKAMLRWHKNALGVE